MPNKKISLEDDGTIRSVLLNKNNCYVEAEEVEMFERMVSSEDQVVKFSRDSFGERISKRPETLRLMFYPFMEDEPFMKYSKVKHITSSVINSDGNGYTEFRIELTDPVYYLETPESEIRNRAIVESIRQLVKSKDPEADSAYLMKGKPYFEMEVSKFEQVFIRPTLRLEIDDISMFFKGKKVALFGDNGVLSAGERITNTQENREMILRIIKKEGLFHEIFSTRVQFSEKELREKIIPKMRWGKYFEKEAARSALNMLIGQKEVSQNVFIDVSAKMKGNQEFSKIIKNNKRLKVRFRNDHAILLLIAMS